MNNCNIPANQSSSDTTDSDYSDNNIEDSSESSKDSENNIEVHEASIEDSENNDTDSGVNEDVQEDVDKNSENDISDSENDKEDADLSEMTTIDHDTSLFVNPLGDAGVLSEKLNILEKDTLLDDNIPQASTNTSQSTQEKEAFFYLNTRYLNWNDIDYSLCYYVGKGSISGSIGTKGDVKSTYLKNVPAYDGGAGRVDISWDYFEYSNGYYRIYGTITPYPNTTEEKTAYYYLNTSQLKKANIDYHKCYYIGKGSVIEECDYRDKPQNVTTSVIPEYHNQVGRYSISWDYIALSDGAYRVYGKVTPAPDIQIEKKAFFYLNVRGYDFNTIDYKKCYYVGSGSVIEVDNYLGEVVDIKLTNIPKYNGSLGPYNISWEKKVLTSGDVYQIFAMVVKKDLTFDTVASLQQFAYLEIGDVVMTKGFYSPNDGGGAEYTITDNPPAGSNMLALQLANGLYAVLSIKNNTITANQFGAYGDGVHDDVKAIQQIIDLGYNVRLIKGQTYKFISNGLYLSKPVSIIGNNATILVDGSYSPSDDCKYYLIRNRYGNRIKAIDIRYLNIRVEFPDNRISGKEFVVISPLQIDNISLQNINIETSKTNNCVVCAWISNGCNSLKISNCKFLNRTTGSTGGSLWLTTKDSTPYSIQDLRKCEISNSYIFSSAGDEVLGIWGAHNINATFTDSTIEGNISALGTTRVISVLSSGNNTASKNVVFSNCEIKAACEKESQDSYYDSIFGIGSECSSSSVNVSVSSCKINSSIRSPIIFPSCFKPENISQYDAKNRAVSIDFNDCEINCASTVTGTTPAYYDTSVVYPTYAWDCQFNNCNITCLTAFAFLYVSDNAKYYIPKIIINNCNIVIKQANAIICQAEKSAGIDLEIYDTDIIANTVDDIINSRLSRVRHLTTQKNASNQLKLSGVSINGDQVK